jgi:DNA-binding IclR family transcriptional regulator
MTKRKTPRGSSSETSKQSTLPSKRRRPKWAVSSSHAAKPTGEDGPYLLRSISRALDVLESFDENHSNLTLKELSRIVGVPDSSLFRMLVTLQNRDYLQQNDDGSYQLSPRVLHGKLYERAEHLRKVARQELQGLASHFNENASMAYLFGERIQVIDSVDSLHEIRITNRRGRVLPPHCSAMGKAITAFQSREDADRILETYGLNSRTPHSISDRRELIAQFEHVRKSGIAYDREESTLGGICIAAPIRIKEGRVVAAISVSTPTARMTPDREAEIEEGVAQTAADVTEILGRLADHLPNSE